MNLKLVTGPAFSTHCRGCHKPLVGGDQPFEFRTVTPYRMVQPDKVYADLNGEPYASYYCETCATGKNEGGQS